MKHLPIGINISDPDLLSQFSINERKAFGSLYNRYWRCLVLCAMQYLDDLAACEDIVQELLVKFYTEEHYRNIKTSLSCYLYAALKNRIFNHLRKQAIYKKHLLSYCKESFSFMDTADKKILSSDLEKRIGVLVDKLPEKYREVYILRYDHEFTIKKISGMLKRPFHTIEKQSRKVSGFLKENLGAYRK
ncbi:MAG TPA: sigma-70 family RNA polymerase sigma factor [Parafilimonas sp.]|nr:sigma-70 family RNA polymerase sigma factor [Parafilimonas sp.]